LKTLLIALGIPGFVIAMQRRAECCKTVILNRSKSLAEGVSKWDFDSKSLAEGVSKWDFDSKSLAGGVSKRELNIRQVKNLTTVVPHPRRSLRSFASLRMTGEEAAGSRMMILFRSAASVKYNT
jgi:hypothetical protein